MQAPVSAPCTSWSCRSAVASELFHQSPVETKNGTHYIKITREKWSTVAKANNRQLVVQRTVIDHFKGDLSLKALMYCSTYLKSKVHLHVFWIVQRVELKLWGQRPSQTASPLQWTRRRGFYWAAADSPAQTLELQDLWWSWLLPKQNTHTHWACEAEVSIYTHLLPQILTVPSTRLRGCVELSSAGFEGRRRMGVPWWLPGW